MPGTGECSRHVVFDGNVFLSLLKNVSSVNYIKAMPTKTTSL